MTMQVIPSLQQQFQNIYDSLNEKQRLAVDSIDGPVMVIAGPGTGKTQILSARIAKILLQTDAQPENILCLTYTDAGAVAMRRRLQTFIGPAAYKVNISTFHAFCNDVIQENLSLFEKNAMDPISDLEKMDLFRRLIDQLPKGNLLKRYRGDVYFDIKNMQSLFSVIKREGWTVEHIKDCIQSYLADLPLREEFIYQKTTKFGKAGELKQNKFEEEKEKMQKLEAMVDQFPIFMQMMKQEERYDFDDMINWVIDVFEKHPNVLLNYQERYQYVLVDEFQDTSGTQNKIVQQLIRFWGEAPNVFVVGDDDQSIYRFQGANIENLQNFANEYVKALQTIVLTNNYRSTQPILDAAKGLIENNEERLVKKIEGLSKDLVAANEKIAQLNILPTLSAYANMHQEMLGVTLQIEKLLAENVLPKDIAVIYKENKYGDSLMQFLQLKKIPLYSKRSINLFDLPFAKKLINILQYLHAEHDIAFGGEELLFSILHFDFYKNPAIEIAKLSVEADKLRYSGEVTGIRKLLNNRANQPAKTLFDTGLEPSLKSFIQVFEQLIKDVPNVTLQQLFSNIITNAGVLPYIMQHADKIQLMKQLEAFFNFIKEETRRKPNLTLKSFVQLLEIMQKEKIPLPLVDVLGSEKGVNLLTAHGSKGLEFTHVFFVGCNSSFWEKKRKPNVGFKLPDTIFSSHAKGNDNEELRRLFYVAMTRAETHLHLSYALNSNDGKPLEPSQFVAEVDAVLPFKKINPGFREDELFAFNVLQYQAQAPELGQFEEDFIVPILEKFVMNVTALNNYLHCPLEFYYKNLLRIPSGKSEASEFGSAIHYALQRFFEKMKDNGNVFGHLDSLLADFTWNLKRRREHFTAEQFKRRIEYGPTILSAYYEKYILEWNKVVSIERNIRNVTVQNVPLKGKLDKLEFDGANVNVVDYKSGDPDKAKEKLKSPSDKDPNGGDYWRQATFYKILVDNDSTNKWQAISTEFDFVEPNAKKEYVKTKLIIQPQDITTVTQQIVDTWTKIQARDFYKGCGKKDCHWCNFVKDNHLAIALHAIDEEDEL